jgi:hypothetical protein
VLKQIVAQDEAVLKVVNVGDVYRSVIVVEERQLAVGGRFAEPDFEQVGRFRISDADRESPVGVGNDHVLYLDDLWQRRRARESLAVAQKQPLIEVQVDDRKGLAAVELDASEEGVGFRRNSLAGDENRRSASR